MLSGGSARDGSWVHGSVSCYWLWSLRGLAERGQAWGGRHACAFTPSTNGHSAKRFLPIPELTFGTNSFPTVFTSGLHVSVLNLTKYCFQCLITI